jgi:ATP-dependent RNA helicase DHX29
MERGFPWVDDPRARWNCQSGRPGVVKGALSAALYPQVACMDSETQATKRPAWLANDLSVSVHPSSVLHPLLSPQYLSPFVLFSEKMQTSSVYMRDISVVPAIALVLFGGHLEVHHDSGYILLDSWLKVLPSPSNSLLLKLHATLFGLLFNFRFKCTEGVCNWRCCIWMSGWALCR